MGPNPQAGPPLVSGDYFPSRLVSGEYLADSTLGLLAGDNASFVMILHAISPTEDDACAHTYEQYLCPLPPTPRNCPFENFFCLWVFPLSRCPVTYQVHLDVRRKMLLAATPPSQFLRMIVVLHHPCSLRGFTELSASSSSDNDGSYGVENEETSRLGRQH